MSEAISLVGRENLLAIYIVQHFLIKLLPRDAVPSGYDVRGWCKSVKEDAHVPTVFQIQVAQMFGILSSGKEANQLSPNLVRISCWYCVVKSCSVYNCL